MKLLWKHLILRRQSESKHKNSLFCVAGCLSPTTRAAMPRACVAASHSVHTTARGTQDTDRPNQGQVYRGPGDRRDRSYAMDLGLTYRQTQYCLRLLRVQCLTVGRSCCLHQSSIGLSPPLKSKVSRFTNCSPHMNCCNGLIWASKSAVCTR